MSNHAQKSVDVTSLVLRLLTVAGLVVDAVVHFKLAPTQPPGGSGQLSQVFLFYAEAIVSLVVALAVTIRANRWTYLAAVVVAGTALAAVLLSRYVDIGAVGPLPDMYEPFWYTSKVTATVGEAVALVTAAVAAVSALRHRTVLVGTAA